MNRRKAILKTADLFEQKPEVYNFFNVVVPPDCGSPGCLVGHIASFMGVAEGVEVHSDTCSEALGVTYGEFFMRMSDIHIGIESFTRSPSVAASRLRIYADKYHPETDHIPASVREIFSERSQIAA